MSFCCSKQVQRSSIFSALTRMMMSLLVESNEPAFDRKDFHDVGEWIEVDGVEGVEFDAAVGDGQDFGGADFQEILTGLMRLPG
jgi:hypothetical protein